MIGTGFWEMGKAAALPYQIWVGRRGTAAHISPARFFQAALLTGFSSLTSLHKPFELDETLICP
jgi:hypothetical protein